MVASASCSGRRQRVRALGQCARADRDHPVAVEPARVERRIDLGGDGDRRVEPLVEPGEGVGPGVDVDMQVGLRARAARAAAASAGSEANSGSTASLRRISSSWPVARSIASASASSAGPTSASSRSPASVEMDRLVAPLEQGMADMALERLDSAGQRRRGQGQRLGGRLDRARARGLDERLDRGERRQPLHLVIARFIVRCTLFARTRCL